MKKLLATLLVFAMCFGLWGCKSCDHQYAENITKEATCSEVGEKTFTCSLCNESYTEEIPVIPHSFGEAAVSKEATCIAEGEKSAACAVCGATEVVETIAKTEHTFGEPVITKAPTCTEVGEQTGTCTICQEATTSEVPATGHSYEENVTKSAGCTTDGTKTITCKNCGDSSTEAIKAFGHNWQSATCTAPKTCGNCGLTEGSALGHDWTAATCTTAKTCSRCNGTEGSALGHKWDAGTIKNEPTYTSAGLKYYTCTVCSAVEFENMPKLQPTVTLPGTPLTISNKTATGCFTSFSTNISTLWQGEISIRINYSLEITQGEHLGFYFKLYDSQGYMVDDSYWYFDGSAGEKTKDYFTFNVPCENYRLEIVGK